MNKNKTKHCGSRSCQLTYGGEIYQQCECACTDCCAARRVDARADAVASVDPERPLLHQDRIS